MATGDIIDVIKHKVLRQTKRKDGYMSVRIVLNDDSICNKLVHRLLAEAFIAGYHHGLYVDHISSVRDDNSLTNLRLVTNQQNAMNANKTGNNTSSLYKGVYWKKSIGKWCARIMINNKYMHIGYYTTEESAAMAYNDAAIKHYGEHACINQFNLYIN